MIFDVLRRPPWSARLPGAFLVAALHEAPVAVAKNRKWPHPGCVAVSPGLFEDL
jgi:hypothetical protein